MTTAFDASKVQSATAPSEGSVATGAEVREPAVAHGPFIMNEMSQIEAAVARYRAGAMGRLAPLSDKGTPT